MKRIFGRAAAFTAAAVMAFSAASCSSKKGSSNNPANQAGADLPDDLSISLEDMPYGGEYEHITAGEDDFKLDIEIDPRYVTRDAARALVNYFYSFNTQDPEYLKKAVPADLIAYHLKNDGYESEKAFLDAEYEFLMQYTGSEFTMDCVLIDGISANPDSTFAYYDNLMKTVSPDCNITDRKLYYVDCTYHKPDDDGSYSLRYRFGDYMEICIYTIDGTEYVIS